MFTLHKLLCLNRGMWTIHLALKYFIHICENVEPYQKAMDLHFVGSMYVSKQQLWK